MTTIINKYTAKFIGIEKTVYAWNLDQAFQEAKIFANEKCLVLESVIDLQESIDEENTPYFGIYAEYNA